MFQVHTLTKRPAYMFMLLRHLTCGIKIFPDDPDNHVGMIRFAHFLNLAPQLETLQLHVSILLIYLIVLFNLGKLESGIC